MKHTLTCGIVINDYRDIGLGVFVKQIETRFFTLNYAPATSEFYLTILSKPLFQSDFEGFHNEMEVMRIAMVEANQLFKSNQNK